MKWATGWISNLALAILFGALSSTPVNAETLVGFTQIGNTPILVVMDSASPSNQSSFQSLRGVTTGQQLVAMDVRPATGELFAVGVRTSAIQLYRINLTTRTAIPVGEPYTGLINPAGTQFGFDFNPMIDRVRLVSTAGQNLVFNPDTGAVTVATNLFYGPGDESEGEVPAVAHVAYDNNVAGTSVTQQRGIDAANGTLVTVANNLGTLGTIGPLGLQVTSIGGFDISGETGIGYAIITPQGNAVQLIYTINLQTGQATAISVPGFGFLEFRGLAVLPE